MNSNNYVKNKEIIKPWQKFNYIKNEVQKYSLAAKNVFIKQI